MSAMSGELVDIDRLAVLYARKHLIQSCPPSPPSPQVCHGNLVFLLALPPVPPGFENCMHHFLDLEHWQE